MDTQTTDFALALARLSQYPIGLQEATVLLLIAAGYDSNPALAGATDSPMNHIYSRTNILRRKKLINAAHTPRGNIVYTLAPKGRTMVDKVIGGGE